MENIKWSTEEVVFEDVMWIELPDDSAYWRAWFGGVKASLCQ